MDGHQDEGQFKVPLGEFSNELDMLEHRQNGYNVNDHIARMSLYQQFDPLVEASKSPLGQPIIVNSEPVDNGFTQETSHNESSTLIRVNTPASKNQHYENNGPLRDQANTNGHFNVDEILDVPMNNQQDDELDRMEELLSEMVITNEQIVDFACDHFQSIQQQLLNSQQEEDKLIIEKNRLIEEMNSVEGNFLHYHTRSEANRAIIKEMEDREVANKDKISELTMKLNDKDRECRNWKQMAEESAEKANLRSQNASSKETVSLKAQIKVLEMRVNSLQLQIEQKSRENEELSHIVDELINKN